MPRPPGARPEGLHRPGDPRRRARRGRRPSTRPPAPRLDDLEERLAKIRDEVQQADRDRATLQGPQGRPRLGLNRKDGAGALLAASGRYSGMLGSVAALLTVRSGYEAAVAGALGNAADAVVVADADGPVGALGHLKDDELGRAGLLLGGAPTAEARLTGPARPARRTPSTWCTPRRPRPAP